MFEELYDLNRLYKAYEECLHGVKWKYSIQSFQTNLLNNLYFIAESIKNGTYRQEPFVEFNIHERGKLRHIRALSFKDRIVQRNLCNIIYPIIKPKLIYDNSSCIKERGVDFARKRVKYFLQSYYKKYHTNEGWVLQIDFKKYFENIDHNTMMNIFSKYIKDTQIIDFIKYLISTFGNRGVGLGSQLSQICGILYPYRIDNWCKIIKRIKYYHRYADDTIMLFRTKEEAINILKEYTNICKQNNILLNSNKTEIKKLQNGFEFLKMKYLLDTNGLIKLVPDNSRFTRERIKLKKLDLLLIDINEQYKSWKGSLVKYKCKRRINKLDKLVRDLNEKRRY